jgi:hypothetical protein
MAMQPVKMTRAAVLAQIANGIQPAALEDTEVTVEEPETPAVEPKVEAPATTAEVTEESEEDGFAQLLNLTRDNAKLEVKVESLEAELTALKESGKTACGVIRTAVERLGIALGSTVIGLEDSSLGTLCAQFAKLDAEFNKKFPVGGTARPLTTPDATTQIVGNELALRAAAARHTTKRK